MDSTFLISDTIFSVNLLNDAKVSITWPIQTKKTNIKNTKNL